MSVIWCWVVDGVIWCWVAAAGFGDGETEMRDERQEMRDRGE